MSLRPQGKKQPGGHYVRQRTHNVRAHALRSDQNPFAELVWFLKCVLIIMCNVASVRPYLKGKHTDCV